MTPRRSFLTGTAAVAATAAVPALSAASSRDQDAELIRLSEEFVRLSDVYYAACRAGGDEVEDTPFFLDCEARMQAVTPRLRAIETRLCDMPATTPAGIKAKALAAWCASGTNGSASDHPFGGHEEWLSFSLIADVLGRKVDSSTGGILARRTD